MFIKAEDTIYYTLELLFQLLTTRIVERNVKKKYTKDSNDKSELNYLPKKIIILTRHLIRSINLHLSSPNIIINLNNTFKYCSNIFQLTAYFSRI